MPEERLRAHLETLAQQWADRAHQYEHHAELRSDAAVARMVVADLRAVLALVPLEQPCAECGKARAEHTMSLSCHGFEARRDTDPSELAGVAP